jgi:hypothetical protein
MDVILKPQDLLVTLKMVALVGRQMSYSELALELGMSPSEVHSAVRRAKRAGLLFERSIHPSSKSSTVTVPGQQGLLEFLIHGVRYVFVPEDGGETRGIPTGYAAPPLNEHIVGGGPLPPVWPYAEGKVRGLSFSPLYRSVPFAAERDPALYELLTLVDALRAGRARERKLAADELRKRVQAE